MADILYKVNRSIVTGLDFGTMVRQSISEQEITFLHNSKYDIKVTGMYLKPQDISLYSGDATPAKDYAEVLDWADQWSKGITVFQGQDGTLLKNKQGSSKAYAISLVQNNGIVTTRGKRSGSSKTNDTTQIELLIEETAHSVVMGTNLQGWAVLYSDKSNTGIIVGGSDTPDLLAPRLAVRDTSDQIIEDSGREVFAILKTDNVTEAMFGDGYYIDGVGHNFVLSFFTDNAGTLVPYATTQETKILYRIRSSSGYYDEATLKFRIEIPEFVRASKKIDVGFQIDFIELT